MRGYRTRSSRALLQGEKRIPMKYGGNNLGPKTHSQRGFVHHDYTKSVKMNPNNYLLIAVKLYYTRSAKHTTAAQESCLMMSTNISFHILVKSSLSENKPL
jgi:hypothetical protein